tara:strand:+ start:235 stop:540 length:306 start_codon:yes stop_codon:yes gene_type:complete
MIERGLQDIVALRGVTSVLLVEEDGFVVHRTDSEDSNDMLQISTWLEMTRTVDQQAVITLVMERGYVVLKPVARRTLMVSCERNVNLGAVRKVLDELDWAP